MLAKIMVTHQRLFPKPFPCQALVKLPGTFVSDISVIVTVLFCFSFLCSLHMSGTIKLPGQLWTTGSSAWFKRFLHLCHVQSIQGPAPPLPNRALFIAHYDLNKEAARTDGITKRWLWICRLAFGFHVDLPHDTILDHFYPQKGSS